MVRKFSKFVDKRPGWVSPSAPLTARKQVYLPNFTVALIRTPFLPPRFASFYVPLNFNKLDMRDYLQRLYGVGVVGVRSTVEQQKVTRQTPDGSKLGKWRRPQSKKRMTVEMKEPFVWPEVPATMEAWEQEQYNNAQKFQDDYQQSQLPPATRKAKEEQIDGFEADAKKILNGEKVWRPTWQALGLSYDRSSVESRKGDSGSS